MVHIVSTGTQADRSADIQAAVDGLSSDGGIISFGPGPFFLEDTITIDRPIKFVGEGKSSTVFQINDATIDIFKITTQKAVCFESLSFNSWVSKTSGSYILFDPGIGLINYGSRIADVSLNGHFVGIFFKRAAAWSLRDSLFDLAVSKSVWVKNDSAADAGDSSISGCQFVGTATSTSVWQTSSGGLRISNCKFLGPSSFGYVLQLDNSLTMDTSVLLITGCSFEGLSENAISFYRSSGNNHFGLVIIADTEIAYCPIGINITDPSTDPDDPTFRDFRIDGLIVDVPTNGVGITINGGKDIAVNNVTFTSRNGVNTTAIYAPTATIGSGNIYLTTYHP